MVETRSKKASEDEKTNLPLQIHRNPALDENRAGRGTEGNGNRRLTKESCHVEQGHNFYTSTGTLDRHFDSKPGSKRLTS